MTQYRTIGAAALACLLGACSSQDSGPATTTPAPPLTTPATPATSSSTSTSTSTTSTSTSTTAPPELELVVEAVADLPGRALVDSFIDGTSVVALSQLDGAPPVHAVIRLDPNGVIVEEVPVTDAIDLFEVIDTNGRLFVHGYFEEPTNTSTCGLRELDPATLLLGPSLALPTDSGCGGSFAIDDGNPAVITLSDVGEPVLFRVDTGAGVVTPVPLAPAVPPEYRVADVFILNGITYATTRPDVDPTTGNEIASPDGSPLPVLIARLDQAGAIAVAEVAGSPRLDVDRIVVPLNDTEWQVIDPSSLEPTEIVAASPTPVSDLVASSDDVSYSFDIGDGTTLTVYQRDPATGEIARQAAVPVPFDPTRNSRFRGFVIDDQFLVVATQPGFFNDEPSASMVFRASLRPVGG